MAYYQSMAMVKTVETPYKKLSKTLKNLLDMAQRMYRKPFLYITGGDPILHSRFWDFLELIHSHKIEFAIMGNPFHLNKTVCERMQNLGCQKYQLSLDGLRFTHDFLRKKESFDITLSKIADIKSAGMRCAVMTTVSAINIKEIPDLIDVVVANKVDVFSFARYCPTDKASAIKWHIPPKEYYDFLDKCWQKFFLHKDCKTTFNLKDHLWILYLYEKGLWKIPNNSDAHTIYDGCHCGNSHFTITTEGRLMPCRRIDSYVGSTDEKMYKVFYSKKMNYYRQYDNFAKCSKCELLRFCRGCPAVAFGYEHDFYAPNP